MSVSGTVVQPRAPALSANEIVGVTFQNAGQGSLAAGVATFGQAFQAGDLPAGSTLQARIGGAIVPVQVDAKTFHEDGSVKFAVLSVARPDLAAGESVAVMLGATAAGGAGPALQLETALAGRSFVVEITPSGGATKQIDVLQALRDAVASGTASFWQQGPLATEARVSVDLPGSQRLVFDVTVFTGGGYSVQAQFNNDEAMGATGGTVTYQAVVRMDGREVDRETVTQAQYQNWRETYSSTAVDGGQGLGGPAEGWLNIQHDVRYLQETGAIAQYDLAVGISETLLQQWGTAAQAAGWGTPLATNGVTTYMPTTGGREDLGMTTAANTAWLMSQDARAAEYALGQAAASGAVPWNFWDAANGTWLNTESYPQLWTDARGGTGKPGDPKSTGLTQQVSKATGWTPDLPHQPELSFVPYLLTGDRAILDSLLAQATHSIMSRWPEERLADGIIIVNGHEVRASAWSLRQIENALWAAPEGSAEQTYLQSVSDANWAWLIEQIPVWTAMQGEAHGWLPGTYTVGSMAPWQQDYLASTVIAAASRGNEDALTFLKWQSNFLVGRFFQAEKGFAAHDGAAYNIAIGPLTGGGPYKTWAEIGEAMAARGMSNSEGWKNEGEYARLAGATLAGIYLLTGSEDALAAYLMLITDSAPGMGPSDYASTPQYAVTIEGLYAGAVRGTDGNDDVAPSAGGKTLAVDLGAGFDVLTLGPGGNTGKVRNVEILNGSAGNDVITIEGAAGGSFVDLGAGSDTLSLAGGGRVTVVNVERIIGGAAADDLVLGDVLRAGSQIDLGGGADRVKLADGGNVTTLRNVETVLGGRGADDVQLGTAILGGHVDLDAGNDVLRLTSGPNRLLVRNVETVIGNGSADDITLGTPLVGGLVDLGGSSDVLRLAGGGNSLTVANVETVLGGAGADAVTVTGAGNGSLFDLGAGADVLRLATASAVSVQAAGVETVLGGAANETVTLLTTMVDGVVSLEGGTDTLVLANGQNRVQAHGVESILGGTGGDNVVLETPAKAGTVIDLGLGADMLTLKAIGNVLTVRNVEAMTGAGGADVVTLGTVARGAKVNLLGGLDQLFLAQGDNVLEVRHVETLIGGSGADDVTFGVALPKMVVDLGGGLDVLRLAAGTNGLQVTNVETILGAGGVDQITVMGSTAARVEGGGGADVIVGGGGADRLVGDAGADTLTGGGGADWFIFRGAGDAPRGTPDVITDFSHAAGDRIVFEGLELAGFAFRGAGPLVAGGGAQARFTEATKLLEIDLNGDATADMGVVLQGVSLSGLSSASFIIG